MQLEQNHTHHFHEQKASACVTLHDSFLKNASCSQKQTFFSLAFFSEYFTNFAEITKTSFRATPYIALLLFYLLILHKTKIKFFRWLTSLRLSDDLLWL
ncbi:MAG: hypothetical protein JNN11_01815 [Candidatus Doudnabacteria bacterium]|nr:hypothetical protein [Candidatus Doudnabacteria bacterium]